MLEKYEGSFMSVSLSYKHKMFIIFENRNDKNRFYKYFDNKSKGNKWIDNPSVLIYNIDGGTFEGVMLCFDNVLDIEKVREKIMLDCLKLKIKIYWPYVVDIFGNEINF